MNFHAFRAQPNRRPKPARSRQPAADCGRAAATLALALGAGACLAALPRLPAGLLATWTLTALAAGYVVFTVARRQQRWAHAPCAAGRPAPAFPARELFDPNPFRWMAKSGGGAKGAPPAKEPAPAKAAPGSGKTDDERTREVGAWATSSAALNLGTEAYRRGRFSLNDLEEAFGKVPVLASGSQAALRGADLQELVKIVLSRINELAALAQADQKSTDLVYLHVRPQRVRCSEILLREEFVSREAMRNLCEALEIPTTPDEAAASMLNKLNRQLVEPGTGHLIAGYVRDQSIHASRAIGQLIAQVQGWARGETHTQSQVAAANKQIIIEIFPAALRKDRTEWDRVAVIVNLELVVSAESTDGVAFHESDFKDQALPQLARVVGADITPREKGPELSDKEMLEAINRRMSSGDWSKTMRNYLAGQNNLTEMASRLHNATIRYPHAQLFLGRRLIMEVLDNLFIKKQEEGAGYRDVVYCPAFEADYHQLDMKRIPFHLNMTADGNRGFVRYMHADRITLLGPEGKGYRIDMGKPHQVEHVAPDESGIFNPVDAPSTNRLEVDVVRMRAASIIAVLTRLHQKLVGVTQNQLLAGLNELTPEERYYLEKLLQPLIIGTGALHPAEVMADNRIFEIGALLGVPPAPGEPLDSFLDRVNGTLTDYRCINNLLRYCRSNDLYARYEKPLRDIDRMRNEDRPMEDIALMIKVLLRQMYPHLFRKSDEIRFEDLLVGYEDISAFLKAFLLRHSFVLQNLSEFVAGWQDTLSIELAFLRKGGAAVTRGI